MDYSEIMSYRSRDVVDIHGEVKNFGLADWNEYKDNVFIILGSNKFLEDENYRIGVIKMILGGLPELKELIRTLLNKRLDDLDFEVHFSMFCFIDQIQDLPLEKVVVSEILGYIEEYLLGVRRETAFSAWMAGDLLGCHWKIDESLPILKNVVGKARFVAGRKGGLYGLYQACKRHQSREALLSIQDVIGGDESKKVQWYGRFLLRQLEQ